MESFVYRRRWHQVDYPEAGAPDAPANHRDDYVGFRIEVLSNPNGAEVNDEAQRWEDVTKSRATLGEYLTSIAPRVRGWNFAYEVDDGGGVVEADPPAVAGETAFYLLPNDLMYWVIVQVKRAHLPKAGTPTSKAATTTDGDTPSGSDPAGTPLDD